MSYLIDKRVLYKQTAEWEAQALAMVEKTMHDEDPTEWRRWSAVLTERTAFKHDIFDAPTVEAVPIEYMQSQVDCGKWEEIIQRWKEYDNRLHTYKSDRN